MRSPSRFEAVAPSQLRGILHDVIAVHSKAAPAASMMAIAAIIECCRTHVVDNGKRLTTAQ
jgi:hypothetical protein